MASTSEVGHAKNLANLQKLIDLTSQITVPPYNPNNPQLTVVGLTALQTQCATDFNSFTAKFTTYKSDTNNREIAFKPLKQLVTQVLDHVKTLTLPVQTINDIAAIVHKIHGLSNKVNKTAASAPGSTTGSTPDPNSSNPDPAAGKTIIGPPVPLPGPTTGPTDNSISTSQQSYDSLLANLDKLISRLQVIPSYSPNEVDIQVTSLNTLDASLHSLNLAAINATNALSLARNQRNLTFYSNNTGMYDITKKVKLYIRQIAGSNSALYHQAAAIKFVKYSLVSKKKKKTK